MGEQLAELHLGSETELKEAQNRFYTWDEFNIDLLKSLFTTEHEAERYAQTPGLFFIGSRSFSEKVEDVRDDIASRLRRLESVIERLSLFGESDVETSSPQGSSSEASSQEAIARQLMDVLERIREGGYQDRQLIQEAKNLNARLGPTYTRMYNGIPLITTTSPPRVWWTRAYDHAGQALAVASAGQATRDDRPRTVEVTSDKVFVVHGHDHGLKEATARFIERLGYKAVILHERPDRGQTIIEKFERESPDAAFAVVLLTPDDEGRLRSDSEDQPDAPRVRARQSVVWEFGYFTAVLGRAGVAALVVESENLERPTDVDGVIYIPVRSIEDQEWRIRLAREMRAAGLDVDLNVL